MARGRALGVEASLDIRNFPTGRRRMLSAKFKLSFNAIRSIYYGNRENPGNSPWILRYSSKDFLIQDDDDLGKPFRVGEM
jgi:hypothetical protein